MLCFVVLFEENCVLLMVECFCVMFVLMFEKFEVEVGCIEVMFLYFVNKMVLVFGV